MEIDELDRKILQSVQQDFSPSIEHLADLVGLSRNAVWRRLRALEQNGYIMKKVALLDPDKLGVGLLVFIHIRTNQHDAEWRQSFASAIKRFPQIMSALRMTGDLDYLLKARVGSMTEYDALYQSLTEKVPLSDVSASFVMENLKDTKELPL